MIGSGQICKAMRHLLSNGVADINDPVIRQQLEAKYPERGRPESVVRGEALHSMSGLRDEMTSLVSGKAPGCGGLRPEYLLMIGRLMSQEGMQRLEELGMMYIWGELPPWYYVCALSVQTVAIYKTEEKVSVRPLGLRNPLLKTWHKMVSKGSHIFKKAV